MKPGQILVADHDGVFVIKMVGDVRLTLCMSFDQFINDMFSRDEFVSVLFDLSDAEAIDSTTLGLMAKISLLGKDQHNVVPVILSTNDNINRILASMGFREIFHIVHSVETSDHVNVDLPTKALDAGKVREDNTKDKVIEAHKILMQLNDKNHSEFKDLVGVLESDISPT